MSESLFAGGHFHGYRQSMIDADQRELVRLGHGDCHDQQAKIDRLSLIIKQLRDEGGPAPIPVDQVDESAPGECKTSPPTPATTPIGVVDAQARIAELERWQSRAAGLIRWVSTRMRPTTFGWHEAEGLIAEAESNLVVATACGVTDPETKAAIDWAPGTPVRFEVSADDPSMMVVRPVPPTDDLWSGPHGSQGG